MTSLAYSSAFYDRDNQILPFVADLDTLNFPKGIHILILRVDLIYLVPYLIPLFQSSYTKVSTSLTKRLY